MSDEKTNERELELLAVQNTMSTEIGRHFMFRCLEIAGVFSDTFNDDPLTMAMNNGKRRHGLWLDAELREASFDNYLVMIKENRNE